MKAMVKALTAGNDYMMVPVDRENVWEIVEEGIQAAVFALASTARFITCVWLLLAWIVRKVKAGLCIAWNAILCGITTVHAAITKWITVGFDAIVICITLVWVGLVELCPLFTDVFFDICDWAAPLVGALVEEATKAWKFREELVKATH